MSLEHEVRPFEEGRILDAVGLGVLRLDGEGRVLAANEAFSRLVGGDVVGVALADLVDGAERRVFRKRLRGMLRSSTGKRLEARLRSGAAELRWVRLRPWRAPSVAGSDAKGGEGYAGGLSVVVEDITETRELERRLVEAEIVRDLVAESSTEWFAYYDLDLRLRWSNVTAAVSSGVARDRLVGRRCHEVRHNSSEPCENCPVVMARESGRPAQSVQQTPDGRIWRLRGFPVHDRDGALIGLTEYGQDISAEKALARERRSYEERLFRSQGDVVVGRLAGRIAQDFGNLVTAFQGTLELARTSPPGSPEQDELLREAEQAAESASELTRRLASLGRKELPEPQDFLLEDSLSAASEFLERLVGEDIQIDWIFGTSGTMVRMDHSLLKQVVVNLVLHAREHLPRGGRILVATAKRALPDSLAPGLAGTGDAVLVDVVGSKGQEGDAVRRWAMQPSASMVAPDDGDDLGLSEAAALARLGDGHLLVESSHLERTVSRLVLPASRRSSGAQPQGEPRAARRPEERATILVVEDDPAVRTVMVHALSRHGHVVLEAENSAVALHVVEERRDRVDLLIAKTSTPDGTGVALAERIRASHPAVRVLLVTGSPHASATLSYRGREWHVLSTPFSPPRLLEKVQEALDSPT